VISKRAKSVFHFASHSLPELSSTSMEGDDEDDDDASVNPPDPGRMAPLREFLMLAEAVCLLIQW
jgi:hypothetical protein